MSTPEPLKVTSTEFLGSFPSMEDVPLSELPEYAFLGRSNVGKSSLINLITGRKELAYTSGSPGKTRAIQIFRINEEWNLTDLPGYGFAKVSKKERNQWEKVIRDYLINRMNLACLFLLIDSNVKPQRSDLDRIRWLGENEIPFALVFTKIDKAGKNKAQKAIAEFQKAMKKEWAFLPPAFSSSAEKGWGKEELLNFIQETNVRISED